MKTNLIKVFLIVSFLIIMIPSGKLTIPNGGILLALIFQTIEFSNEVKLNINFEAIMALVVLGSLTLIILQRKLFNLIGIILQSVWLGYLFKNENLNDIYYIITILLYFVMSSILIIKLYFSKK